MDLDQYYEQIEAYLNNTLSPDARTVFEQQLKDTPALKRAVLNHVLANEALGLVIEDNVNAKLNRLAQQRQKATAAKSATAKIIPFWKRPLAIAASILLVVLAGTFIWSNQQYSNKALTAQFYANSTLPTVRSDQATNANFSNGLVAFSKQNYQEAITHLDQIALTETNYLSAKYLLGHAYLKTNNYQQAYQDFGYLLATASNRNLSNIDQEEVEWNKLMAAMNIMPVNSPVLQADLKAILSNPKHGYYQKAIELDQRLSSTWRRFSLRSSSNN